ncbi:MAG TPA: PilZ domain-containing protein [Candidatus Binatia bacterium]|nr:PilZ domain-containing protein [Candidatus Binatia bacterium]
MENTPKPKVQMHTLLLCNDVAFLGITRSVLHQLQVTPRMVNTSAAAVAMIQEYEFDVIAVDWREMDNIAEFLTAVRRSKLNQDCVLVAIVRDLLDLKQAFAAGVHLLIHKPASAVQIERCLRAAYSATVARRRKHHREAVVVLASVSTRTQAFGEATVVNVSEGGVKLRTSAHDFVAGVSLSAADELNLRFVLPGTEQMLDVPGTVVWATADACGVRFGYIPDTQRAALQEWLTACVERSISRICERVREACA